MHFRRTFVFSYFGSCLLFKGIFFPVFPNSTAYKTTKTQKYKTTAKKFESAKLSALNFSLFIGLNYCLQHELANLHQCSLFLRRLQLHFIRPFLGLLSSKYAVWYRYGRKKTVTDEISLSNIRIWTMLPTKLQACSLPTSHNVKFKQS
jgi:hypothetical protein